MMCVHDYRRRFAVGTICSIKCFELLGIVVTAWTFVAQSNTRHGFARDTISVRGDNMSTGHPRSAGGENEPRSGALGHSMRLLGCLEVNNGRYFDALHAPLGSIAPSLTTFLGGSRRRLTIAYTRSGPRSLGANRYWDQRYQ